MCYYKYARSLVAIFSDTRDYEICEAAWKDPQNASQFWNDAFIKLSRPLPLPPSGTDRKKTRKSGSIGGDEDQSFCSSNMKMIAI